MEIRYLQEFVVLAGILNFSEAADELNMTQAGLSRHIQALEKELGDVLFDRSTRRIALSRFGEWYLPYAKQMAEEYSRAEKDRMEFQKEEANRVVLGSIHNPQFFYVGPHLKAFRKEHPECRVQVIEGEENELFKLYHSGKVDLFCGAFPTGEYGNYNFVPMIQNHMVAVYPKDHPLEGKKAVTLEELQNMDLLLPTRTSQTNALVRDAFAAAGIRPHIIYEGINAGNISLQEDSLGVSIMPKEYTKGLLPDEFFHADIVPEISYTLGIAYRDEPKLSRGDRKLLEYVRKFEYKS